MTNVQFEKTRQPTKKERNLYKRWIKYLSDSNLNEEEIKKRASTYTLNGEKPELE